MWLCSRAQIFKGKPHTSPSACGWGPASECCGHPCLCLDVVSGRYMIIQQTFLLRVEVGILNTHTHTHTHTTGVFLTKGLTCIKEVHQKLCAPPTPTDTQSRNRVPVPEARFASSVPDLSPIITSSPLEF